jgi:imidazolonepropionase
LFKSFYHIFLILAAETLLMKKILIKNIKTLVQVREAHQTKVYGKEMKSLPCIDNAWLAIENDKIVDFGSMDDFPGISDWSNLTVIDATGKMVFPCWVDSHTHIVYAGSREGEFVDRINGLTYQEIAQRGGGILNSAKKLSAASEEELEESAMRRLNEIMMMGTGAVEIKSGYGLSFDDELKMLRVIKRLKAKSPLTIKATFLGAHAVPSTHSYDEYVDLVINKMIPHVAEEGLAEYCDVFCEKGYFSKEDTVKILKQGLKYGLKPRVHANQMSASGGVQAGVEVGALSVDHLEYVGEEEIKALLGSDTMPTLLPGAAFFLGLPNPPARQMIDAGLPVAVATDYNPGSSPCGNMSLMTSLCCVMFKMTPEEAINAATINTAYAMELSHSHGSISIGKQASVFITKEIPSYSYLSYAFGSDLIETVIVNGELIEGL